MSVLAKLDESVTLLRANSPDPEASLTTEEASAFLKIHKQELLRMTKVGLPYYGDMGKGFRFLRRDLIQFRELYRRRTAKPIHVDGPRIHVDGGDR